MAIILEMKKEDEKYIRDYVERKGYDLSKFIIDAALEAVDDAIDIELIKDYEERKKAGKVKYVSAEELFKRLGI